MKWLFLWTKFMGNDKQMLSCSFLLCWSVCDAYSTPGPFVHVCHSFICLEFVFHEPGGIKFIQHQTRHRRISAWLRLRRNLCSSHLHEINFCHFCSISKSEYCSILQYLKSFEMSSCLAQPNILSCDVRTLCFRSFNPWSEVRCLIRSHNPEEIASHSSGRICDGTSMPIGSGFLIMPQYLHQRRPTCLNGITCSLLLVVLESHLPGSGCLFVHSLYLLSQDLSKKPLL